MVSLKIHLSTYLIIKMQQQRKTIWVWMNSALSSASYGEVNDMKYPPLNWYVHIKPCMFYNNRLVGHCWKIRKCQPKPFPHYLWSCLRAQAKKNISSLLNHGRFRKEQNRFIFRSIATRLNFPTIKQLFLRFLVFCKSNLFLVQNDYILISLVHVFKKFSPKNKIWVTSEELEVNIS